MAVRDITNEEGNKLLAIVRRGSGSVVRWRRAQIVLWSAQRMDVPAIAKIAFTSEDRVREVIHNFNADGFDSLAPKYAGGRPPKFTLPERAAIKKIALGRPTDHGEPFSTWSLTKLADHLVRKGVVDDISHEGLRALLREEGVSFQAIKTWKQSNDPDFEVKKNRVLELYDIADGKAQPQPGDPTSSSATTSSAPSTFSPTRGATGPSGHQRSTPGRSAPADAGHLHPAPRGAPPARRLRPVHRQALRAREVQEGTHRLLGLLRYVRTLHPPHVRIAIVMDNFVPHLSTKKDTRVGDWAQANNVELAYTPHYASWLNRIEAQFTALRYFTLDGTDHESHEAQAFLIRRYIAWRNRNAHNETLRELVKRANVA